MSLEFPRRAQAGVAVGFAAACLALSAAPASAASGPRSQEWWLQKLHVTQAWQSASSRAAGVTVAVLDTGVNPKQADLAGAVITGPDYTHSGRVLGGPFWGIHGTAMASLIAGRGHGPGHAAGIMGIAPAATILSVRVTLESNDPMLAGATIAAGLPAAIARGIRYAVRHHAAVIDLPLDPVTAPGAPGTGGSIAERAAVMYALAHNVVLVAPAGDDGAGADPVSLPAAYPGVISVGAFNSQFAKAPFTSRQSYVTLTAAGDGVIAANSPTGYAMVSSTTAASAVVAGIVALIRAQFPALSPTQVTNVLQQSTVFRRPDGQSDGSGAGTVDAARALAAAAKLSEAVGTPASSSAAGTPAAQPPAAPAVPAPGGLRKSLLIDVGIAVAVFLLLAVPILGYGHHRRRKARAARLAEVRAAAQPVPRRPRPSEPVAPDAGRDSHIPSPLSPGLPAAAASRANGRVGGARGRRGAPDRDVAHPQASARDWDALQPQAGPRDWDIAQPPAGAQAWDAPPPPAGVRPRVAGQPPWTPLSSENDLPGAPGSPGRAIPGSAFPGAGRRGAPAEPDDTGEQAYLPGRPGAAGPSRATGAPATGGRRAHAGSAHAAPARGGAAGGTVPGEGNDGPSPAASGPVPGRLIGSHRMSSSRTADIAGGPPWEPATEPAGEFPWARSPAPPPGGPRAFPIGPPQAPEVPVPEIPAFDETLDQDLASWDAIAEEAWPGGPSAGKPSDPPPRGQAAGNGIPGQAYDPWGEPHEEDPAPEPRPIYVWNPAASTDHIPIIPPGENHQQ